MSIHAILSDEKLYLLCKEYGEKALQWKRKFAGLLPEVHKREVAARAKGGSWLSKRGFTCLYEFAAKLAGMSREQVQLVLNLERKFEDKPVLKSLLINGDVSVNKLVRVAGMATPENQEMLAHHVQIFSKNALETLVRDHKNMAISPSMGQPIAGSENKNQNGFQKPLFEGESMHVHFKTYDFGTAVKIAEKLSPEVREKLLKLIDKNINISEIVEKALKEREAKIARDKEEISEELARKPASRHIPARVKKIITAEQGDKCAMPGCIKNAENIHHELPFALVKTHDPYNLKKLCKAHHEITHTINLKFHRAGAAVMGAGAGPPDSG